jgi:hypothetical protein
LGQKCASIPREPDARRFQHAGDAPHGALAAVMPLPIVTVVIDGRPVVASTPALLFGGSVSAPIDPFARLIATRIAVDGERGSITIERDGKRVTFNVPYVRDGRTRIPLGATARALGDSVSYDAATHVLRIDSPPPAPLATMTPFGGWTPPPGPLPTFTPNPVATPRPVVSGVPRPRRTPILVNSE